MNIKNIGRYLAYMNRARQYVGLVNSSLLLIILLNSFGVYLKWYWYPVIILGTVLLFLIVGFVDTRLGIRKMEYLNIEQNQPIRMESYEMLKKIHEKLCK